MSVSWPGSHCPQCKHAIRWYDNIPVLAWLWLGGKCRDCRGAISIRYPLVEAATAAMFLTVLVVEVFHPGANLRSIGQLDGHTTGELLGTCGFHLALLSTLLTAALIAWDGKRPPNRLYVPFGVAALILAVAWPPLHAVLIVPGFAWSLWMLCATIVCVVVLAFITALFFTLLGELSPERNPLQGLFGPLICIGLTFGMQAEGILPVVAVLLSIIGTAWAKLWPVLTRLSAIVWLVPLTFLWILYWQQLAAYLRTLHS